MKIALLFPSLVVFNRLIGRKLLCLIVVCEHLPVEYSAAKYADQSSETLAVQIASFPGSTYCMAAERDIATFDC